MFEHLSFEQLDRLSFKLSLFAGTDPKSIIGLFDYDLTMAAKRNPQNFDDAPLRADHHASLCAFAPDVGHVIVQTARGEATTLDYLNQHGSIQNLSLASNSGHLWRYNISSPDAKTEYIAIPAYENDPELLAALVEKVHDINHALKEEFDNRGDCTLFLVDDRELCGAIIYQFKGKPDSDAIHELDSKARNLVRELGEPFSSLIRFDGKDKPVKIDNEFWTQGYRDGKPDKRDGLSGMDKGHTTNVILTDSGMMTPESILVVAGDSNSDYAMMKLANRLVQEGKARAALCIDIGGKMDDPDKIIDVSFKEDDQYPHSQIDRLYQFLEDIKNTCVLSRRYVGKPKKSAAPKLGLQ